MVEQIFKMSVGNKKALRAISLYWRYWKVKNLLMEKKKRRWLH